MSDQGIQRIPQNYFTPHVQFQHDTIHISSTHFNSSSCGVLISTCLMLSFEMGIQYREHLNYWRNSKAATATERCNGKEEFLSIFWLNFPFLAVLVSLTYHLSTNNLQI